MIGINLFSPVKDNGTVKSLHCTAFTVVKVYIRAHQKKEETSVFIKKLDPRAKAGSTL
jgi:hypothetical protein